MCFCINAYTQMPELVSQMYFFLYSCHILGDNLKNIGSVILIDLELR